MNENAGEGGDGPAWFKLAPLDVELEAELAVLAASFFSASRNLDFRRALGLPECKTVVRPLLASDFLSYLVQSKALPDNPYDYMHHIRRLLDRLAANGILAEMAVGGDNAVLAKSYYSWQGHQMSSLQGDGLLWLARTLGGRFVHWQVGPAVVHIVGSDKDDPKKPRSGSGIVFDRHHVLTCRHVVSGMTLANTQRFQGEEVGIDAKGVTLHPREDVAVICVDRPLTPTPGLGFLAPEIAQRVYAFGFPKVPNVRPRIEGTQDAYLVMQSGEVTNQRVVASDRSELFLYSATSRPGDSGGAIVSEDGHVVGMTTNLAHGLYQGEEPFAPHCAGIPGDVLGRAVAELGLEVELPYERFD